MYSAHTWLLCHVPGVTRWLMGDTECPREEEETDEKPESPEQTVLSHPSLSALKTCDVSEFILSGH